MDLQKMKVPRIVRTSDDHPRRLEAILFGNSRDRKLLAAKMANEIRRHLFVVMLTIVLAKSSPDVGGGSVFFSFRGTYHNGNQKHRTSQLFGKFTDLDACL